jgi:hypothetical protein
MVQSSFLDVLTSANWIRAVIAGLASYGVAVWKSQSDLQTLKTQVAFKNEDTINSLRSKYISARAPLMAGARPDRAANRAQV